MTDEPQTAVEEAVERLESGLTNGDVQSSRFMYSDLRTILSALDALPPRPTDEAVRGLVERLTSVRSMGARKGKLWNADGPEAAALIRSQSAEIARLQALTPKEPGHE